MTAEMPSEPRPPLTEEDLGRFWASFERRGDDDCWLWTGTIGAWGYGRLWVSERRTHVSAHLVAYELLVGPFPQGLQADHLCRVRHCVNPRHIEPVTARENTRRSNAPAAHNARKTHCKRGHEFTAENTHVDSQGKRGCRECWRLRRSDPETAARRREQARQIYARKRNATPPTSTSGEPREDWVLPSEDEP